MNGIPKVGILVTICVLTILAIVATVAIVLVGHEQQTTPVLVTIIGFIATTIGVLLTLIRTEQTRHDVQDVKKASDAVQEEVAEMKEVVVNGQSG